MKIFTRNIRLDGVESRWSTAGEAGDSISTGGRSDSNNVGVISWAVGGSTAGARVSLGEKWDNIGRAPATDDLVVPGRTLTTSPAVGDEVGGHVAVGTATSWGGWAGDELTASVKSGFGAAGSGTSTASNPLSAWSDSDSVGSSNGSPMQKKFNKIISSKPRL